jgi:hypothetical protein
VPLSSHISGTQPYARARTTPLSERDERLRIAYHEAAHAAVAHITKRPIEVVSIRPGPSWSGVCFTREHPVRDADLDQLHLPVPLQPARLRKAVELRIIGCLAGRIGEELGAFYPHGSAATSTDDAAAMALAEAATLTPEQKELLRRGDNPEKRPSTDDEEAAALAGALAGRDEATSYYGWLRATTRSMVYGERCRRLVYALVPVLLEREVVGAAEVRAIFRAADEVQTEKAT